MVPISLLFFVEGNATRREGALHRTVRWSICVLTLLSTQELIQIQLRVNRFPGRPAAVRAEDMPALQVDVHGRLVEAHSRGLLGGPFSTVSILSFTAMVSPRSRTGWGNQVGSNRE